MRNLLTMCFAALASASAVAATVKTATQPWVEAKIADATNATLSAAQSAASAAISAATNGLVTASVTNGLASQSSLTSLSSRVDDKRDKTDLAVYGKYVKWYIVETSGDGRLSEPIEMYDYGGYTFSCDKVNVSGDELHPNRIVCDTEYGDDGKVSAVSGGGETWWPGVDGNEPGYTTASVDMDTAAVNMIHNPAIGEFSAFVQYYDADGNVQYGMVRFRVTYTGGPHELADTLAKTSDLTAVSNAIPTAVADLSDAGDYLKTADLAAKETDPSFNAWTNGTNLAAGYQAVVKAGGKQCTVFGSCAAAYADKGSAFGYFARVGAQRGTAIGYNAYVPWDWTGAIGFAQFPTNVYFGADIDNQTEDGAWVETPRTLQSYLDERATTNALAAVKASIPAISATDATFSNAVNVAARALVKSKLESLDKAKSSIGEMIAALQSIYNETETK